MTSTHASDEADLCGRTAVDLAVAIRGREVSCVEVLEAHLARIEACNDAVAAIVTLDAPGARAAAREADRALARGDAVGLLHGLPVAVKDLQDTAGMRTTYGSPVYRDHVPETDALMVARMRRAGAIVVGKTNTPEFGAGSQTFNTLFGTTRNPYRLDRTAGGSSGGAAAAVACGMVALADGSDLAASVRNPASMCNVVGLRPSPGRIPAGDEGWDALSVLGPIARTVEDVRLLLQATCGPDDRSPLALDEGPEAVAGPLDGDVAGVRVAWSRDLGDLPVAREVTAVLEPARGVLADLGLVVEDAEPDLADADEAFDTLRALLFVRWFGDLHAERPGDLKATIRANVERGLALDARRIARAQDLHDAVHERMRRFLRDYDVLALPVVQVAPFDAGVEAVGEIAGVPMGDYVQWLRSCSRITVTGHPAVSVPAGFTPDGLPVGLQLVGRYRRERDLLRVARAFEAATGWGRRRPPVVRPDGEA